MKKIVIIFLLSIPLLCHAANSSRIELDTRLQYGYNYTWNNYGYASAYAQFRLAPNYYLSAGLCANSANVYSAAAQGKVEFTFPKDMNLSVINQYLYRGYASDNFQEFVLGLRLEFEMNYFTCSFGHSIRFLSQMHHPASEELRYITEPYNLLYLIEGRVRNNASRWNIGLRLSNMRQFKMERMYQPILTIPTYYQYNSLICFTGELGVEPTGVFNMAKQNYEVFIQLGIKLLW